MCKIIEYELERRNDVHTSIHVRPSQNPKQREDLKHPLAQAHSDISVGWDVEMFRKERNIPEPERSIRTKIDEIDGETCFGPIVGEDGEPRRLKFDKMNVLTRVIPPRT